MPEKREFRPNPSNSPGIPGIPRNPGEFPRNSCGIPPEFLWHSRNSCAIPPEFRNPGDSPGIRGISGGMKSIGFQTTIAQRSTRRLRSHTSRQQQIDLFNQPSLQQEIADSLDSDDDFFALGSRYSSSTQQSPISHTIRRYSRPSGSSLPQTHPSILSASNFHIAHQLLLRTPEDPLCLNS